VEEILDFILKRQQFEGAEGKRDVCEQNRLRVRYANGEVLLRKNIGVRLMSRVLTLKMILSGFEMKAVPLNSRPATI